MITAAWRCSAVVESHLRRIDGANPYLNAVAVPIAESAREIARKVDNAATGGPYYGVPLIVKENLDCLASAIAQETPLLVDAMPAGDAVMVEHYVGLICPVDSVR
jgi:Asp-tRNA(Asn)/Glu-tRNA(Gln) amidotransferase A subunit family amidase